PWYNNQSYVDTLNPKAIRRFVELTHERYHQWVGEDFGTIIPAIFCDEPKFTSFAQLAFPWEDIDVSIPYTDDLPDTYLEAWGTNVLDTLPEVIWELPEGKPSLA